MPVQEPPPAKLLAWDRVLDKETRVSVFWLPLRIGPKDFSTTKL